MWWYARKPRYRGQIAGAFEICARQQDEQRRRVDRAVIAAKGNLAGRRHLAAARFMQYLSRLGIALRAYALHGVQILLSSLWALV